MLFSYLEHRRACNAKRDEQAERLKKLPGAYHDALAEEDKEILSSSVATIVDNVQAGKWTPLQVLRSYGKRALEAHKATNCLTEIMIDTAEEKARAINKSGPLAGMPVSVKDTVAVEGYDACIGYSSWSGKPVQKDSALVRLLRDAGAIPFAKTNIPITLLSFESASDIFGRAMNPYNKGYSPGGSSGGEAALLALGGSRIGIGTDVAGSVRVPAHYSGVYTIRASAFRFPKTGNATSMPGQEGVPAVNSPMAKTLEDLETFWKAIFYMKPWTYDHSVLQMPWRSVDLSSSKVKFGVMWSDGVVPPSPACKRALSTVVENLRLDGYEVIDFDSLAPSPYEGLQIASQLLLADGGKTASGPIHWGESNDPGMRQANIWFSLPRFLQRLYVWWVRYVKRDAIYAGLLEDWREKTIAEYWKVIAKRESYRAEWFNAWNNSGMDFLLTVPNALPAVPNNGMKYGFKSCGYTFLFNLLDYTAGVIPITHVSELLDSLNPLEERKLKASSTVARSAYDMYDAKDMSGLPVGVQIVGQRLEEEKVLEGMKLVEKCLKGRGIVFRGIEI